MHFFQNALKHMTHLDTHLNREAPVQVRTGISGVTHRQMRSAGLGALGCSKAKVEQIGLFPGSSNYMTHLDTHLKGEAALRPSPRSHNNAVVEFFAKTGKEPPLINDDDTALPPGPSWQAARKACQTSIDRKRLAAAAKAGWRPEEFSEYARSCHRRRNRDHATSHSYRSALAHHGSKDAQLWRKLFRESGSLPLPPRCPNELDYTPPRSGIGSNHRYWAFHSPELIALIDGRTRAYFGIPEASSIHPHAWIASYVWFQKEQAAASSTTKDA